MTRRRPSRLVVLTLLTALGLPVSPVAAVAEPASQPSGTQRAELSTPEVPPAGRAIGPLAPPATGHRGGGPGDCEPLVDESTSGQEAISELGADLPAVARGHGRSAAELRSTLRNDPSLHVDPCGFLFYVDEFVDATQDHAGDTNLDGHDHAAADSVESGVLATPSPAPLEDAFALHSRPGSNRTVYLDFTGHHLVGAGWNTYVPDGFQLPAYSLDADPTFSAAERAVIQEVWQHVAEDYAPFDVAVTTVDPGEAALERTSLQDQVFGVRAVITSLPDVTPFCPSCAGVGFLGTFDQVDGAIDYRASSLIFAAALPSSDVGRIAITASHEVGHNLNLGHHGEGSFPYTSGQGIWAPLMGAAGWRPVSTWSTGDYRDANNTQDDVAMIAARGAPLAPDDHGTTRQTATELVGTGELTAEGVIATRADQDWFRFTASGLTTISALPAAVAPNLDIELLVSDAEGTLLALDDPVASWPGSVGTPVAGLGASVVQDLAPGTYHARVRGVGSGDPLVDGYSNYGSLGRYSLTVATETPTDAPVVWMTSGPSSLTNQSSATIEFVADRSGVSFECRLDAGAWVPCSSPWSLTGLADGLRTASVRGHLSGLTSSTVSRSWTVDTVAPTITIMGGPAQDSSTTTTTAEFTLSADEAVGGFECRPNSDTWTPCGPSVSLADLELGDQRLEVRATDAAGNTRTAARDWVVTVPTFSDVPSSSLHAVNIGKLAAHEVTLGCGPERYCPDDNVSRAQMATFLLRALELEPGSSSPPFSDVAAWSTHAQAIDAMRREEITLGCGVERFCPSTAVPRDQMASFLQRALPLEPGSASPPFADVPAGSTHARAIDAVRQAEITLGCSDGAYCPKDPVTRAQMASFLVRALGW